MDASNGLDEHTTSECKCGFQVGTRWFPCDTRTGHGVVNFVEMIRTSCNVLCFEHGLNTGIETLSAEARRFGFDKPTGIDVPFESKKIVVPTPEWKKQKKLGRWLGGDTANSTIGQGYLLSTPLHMALFMASIARKETRTQPTLLFQENKQVDHGGEPIDMPDHLYEFMIEGMELAVQKGTAKRARVPGIRIAGKTGTSQVRNKKGNLAWFIGFAPIEDPQIAVMVMLEGIYGNTSYYGGLYASPIAGNIFKQYFSKTTSQILTSR